MNKFERVDGICLTVALALALILGIALNSYIAEPHPRTVFTSESGPLRLVVRGKELGVTPILLSHEQLKYRVAGILGVPEESVTWATRHDLVGTPIVFSPGEAELEVYPSGSVKAQAYEMTQSYRSETQRTHVTFHVLP